MGDTIKDMLKTIRSLVLFSCVLTTSVPVHAAEITLDPSVVSSFPQEIQDLFKKDPQTLTQDEKKKLLPSTLPSAGTQVATPENTVNCFDYYTFGSVQVDLSPLLAQTVPGTPFPFTGMLKNNNPYPIVNGSVYVKIFKHEEAKDIDSAPNGYPLVAFFEAGKDITIPANSEQPFNFDWNVPHNLSGGSFEAAFFFVTDHRFNLLGLSFTDDVTGNKALFGITSEDNAQVVFDKNTVTMNDKPYHFAVFPPHFAATDTVNVKATVVNPSNENKFVSISYQLYNWDGLRSEFLLDTKEETISLKPHEKQIVSYAASKKIGTVSYLIATLRDGDATSILNPRFVRDNVEEVRLNFPSILSYPLEAGKENTLFSCLHSTGFPIVENNTLTLTLTDTDTDEVIHTYTYEGGITGAMMGVKDTFVPTYTPRSMTLTSTLTHNDVTVDMVSQTYDCAVLNPDTCPPPPVVVMDIPMSDSSFTMSFGIIAIVLLILTVLLTGTYFGMKKYRSSLVTPNNDSV